MNRGSFDKEPYELSSEGPETAWPFAAVTFLALARSLHANAQTPALALWNDGPAKQAIVSFVKAVTDKSGTKYVEPQDRIATFDQDGTLWVEHPLYTQAMFALARVHDLAPQHPEWKQRDPFKAVLWLATARDPRFHQPYTALVYHPMLEVMDYLRANGFKTYIVTGGGQEFVRVYSQSVYGIPPEQVVGSSILTKCEYQDGKPVLMREPKVFFIDDNAGKPVGINLFIGKRPYAAFGNSAGDKQMLEWTQAGDGARLMMLVLHDDPVREYTYGPAQGLPDSKVGTFSQALYDQAKSRGWIVISMKKDWKQIFAFDNQ